MERLYLLVGISRQGHFSNVRMDQKREKRFGLFVNLMHQIRSMHPGMGLRKMYSQFAPEGIGRDAFIALGIEAGFRLKPVPNPTRTTIRSKSWTFPNLLVGVKLTGVNQVWVSDLFYFPINGVHYYVVLIMDIYSRRIVGYNSADHMRSESFLKALGMALDLRGLKKYDKKLIHHSDRGSQYISDAYTGLLRQYEIQISVCKEVYENAHMERVNGTIKNEYLTRWSPKSSAQLQRFLAKAVKHYNDRLHDSLAMTPNEFEMKLPLIPIKQRKKMTIYTNEE